MPPARSGQSSTVASHFNFAYSLLAPFRWDVGVGVDPEDEEVLVGGASLGGVTGQSVGAGEAEMANASSWAGEGEDGVHSSRTMIFPANGNNP